MENGYNSFGTQDIITGRGLGIGGFGYPYGAGYGAFASPGSNAVRLDRNAQNIEDQADCTRSVLGLGLDRISDQAEESRRQAQFTAITNAVQNQEIRTADRLRDIEREIAANARTAAECCCELKLENCQSESRLTAEIRAVESRTIERELNAAQARITQLETINAITTQCGCCPGS